MKDGLAMKSHESVMLVIFATKFCCENLCIECLCVEVKTAKIYNFREWLNAQDKIDQVDGLNEIKSKLGDSGGDFLDIRLVSKYAGYGRKPKISNAFIEIPVSPYRFG
jgi:hypothetical protein